MISPIVLLSALVAAYLAVCVMEWASLEVASLTLVVCLSLTGILTPGEALSGFSNPVVLAIAGLFVISAAIEESGLIAWLGGRLAELARRSARAALFLLLLVSSLASMFVSNVATVALLTPAVLAACRRTGLSASRFLMPLAFASLVGGMVTLIGATGNLIVQGMAVEGGAEPFGFFEFGLIGLPIVGVALVYLVSVGWRLVPDRRADGAEITEPLRDFLIEVSVPGDSDLVGLSLAEADLAGGHGVTLLSIRRGEDRVVSPGAGEVLRAEDRLVVKAGSEDLRRLTESGDLRTEHQAQVALADLQGGDVGLFEVLVPPRSALVGRTARDLRLRQRWGVTLLAVLRGAAPPAATPERVRIQPGDELLIQGSAALVEELRVEEDVIVMNRTSGVELKPGRVVVPFGVLASVVLLAATGAVSLAIAALGGAAALVLAGALSADRARGSVDLKVLVVVACVLPLGPAFEAAGGVEPASRLFGGIERFGGAWTVLAVLFLATSGLVQVLQKAAIALAMPLAFAAAEATGADVRPFIMAVAVAGSCAFLTPLAHPVNLLVHAPGQYRFGDYIRVGLPLQIIVTVVAVGLIPRIWPF